MLVLMVDVVAPVLQENDFAPVPPEAFAVTVAGAALPQISTAGTETVGLGFTVRHPEPLPVHPFVSVAVTL